jgi:hypothetical protein
VAFRTYIVERQLKSRIDGGKKTAAEASGKVASRHFATCGYLLSSKLPSTGSADSVVNLFLQCSSIEQDMDFC